MSQLCGESPGTFRTEALCPSGAAGRAERFGVAIEYTINTRCGWLVCHLIDVCTTLVGPRIHQASTNLMPGAEGRSYSPKWPAFGV